MNSNSSKMESRFAAITFFAKSHPGDVCGSNGLPLTPNSIAILGRSQRLKAFRHKNLCEYLDIVRGKHERIFVVSEYYGTTLKKQMKEKLSKSQIMRIFYQVSCGLHVLNENDIVMHNLEPKNILIDENNNIKLFNYGLYYMTQCGEYVSFPIGNIRYIPAERLLGSNNNIKSDVWSLGMIMAELALQTNFWPNLKISNITRKILSFCESTNVFEKIAREHNCLEIYQNLDSDLRDLIEKCLKVLPSQRPKPSELISSKIFRINSGDYSVAKKAKSNQLLLQCPLEQIYYWWQLTGGDVQTDLKKEGLIRSEAPILAIPHIVCLNGTTVGPKQSQSHLMDDRVVPLKLNNLIDRLRDQPASAYYPLILSEKLKVNSRSEIPQLPLLIREKDIEYQFHRVRLFTHLLKGYPFTNELILKEASIDIPPFYRGQIWACILGVIPNGSYSRIDKTTPTTTDRQIEVDIPRCHQYDELLSSPEGHLKLRRLLKAWVTAHPFYVYWQGLDSLTVPFLYLNFNNEELAFQSLYKFVKKYLQRFFIQENSTVIKEYLCKFSQLTAFYEPLLAAHLASINFIPELFAIPWFLTMFSHVFPLHKILHLWDKLILGDNSYPLFIGVSILKQLKSTLMSSEFNECILLFSDLPDVVMETCVTEAQKMYISTPKSISQRMNLLQETKTDLFDISTLTQKEIEETCPRISANDFKNLLKYSPKSILVIDLRSSVEFEHVRVPQSLNIPYCSINFQDKHLDSLNMPHFAELVQGRIVICISSTIENATQFSKFLVERGISRVCVLHKGFNILRSIEPNILLSQ